MRAMAASLICMLASAATATELRISLPGNDPVQQSTVTYACGAKEGLTATYINAGPNSLAVVPVDGQTLIFVTLLSGSCARYGSGPYVWWTKGPKATLTDERQQSSPPLMQCREGK